MLLLIITITWKPSIGRLPSAITSFRFFQARPPPLQSTVLALSPQPFQCRCRATHDCHEAVTAALEASPTWSHNESEALTHTLTPSPLSSLRINPNFVASPRQGSELELDYGHEVKYRHYKSSDPQETKRGMLQILEQE
ncbi:hypothetical protein NMY22_g4283 [Coprinellus aureogranulatus]|nr:hypothetical protein NMY22_g4283 [Coprinellus aureogranulatus]